MQIVFSLLQRCLGAGTPSTMVQCVAVLGMIFLVSIVMVGHD